MRMIVQTPLGEAGASLYQQANISASDPEME
jgi:hypothetical protein